MDAWWLRGGVYGVGWGHWVVRGCDTVGEMCDMGVGEEAFMKVGTESSGVNLNVCWVEVV